MIELELLFGSFCGHYSCQRREQSPCICMRPKWTVSLVGWSLGG